MIAPVAGSVVNDQTTDLIQLARAKPMVPCKGDWCQPKLCVLPIAPVVHVHRLVAVETVVSKQLLRDVAAVGCSRY